jgi:putative tricarboxylic transport membrane protein
MRIAFFAVLLAGAVYYSYVAFTDFNFMTRTGRLGPGFFPRVIGVSAIVVILWAMIDELRVRHEPEGDASAWKDVFLATVIFLGVTLTILNPGHAVKNGAIALLVPGGVYLLFDRLLNANMPPALFNLPI